VRDWDQHTVVGTATQLEKKYFRLTGPANPATIRPLHILRQALDHVVAKWERERHYPYIRDQFKSLRQDLTVQRIQNEFTVQVYERHAWIALESGDLGEFNLCFTKLKELYGLGINGHVNEFLGYYILYLIHVNKKSDMISTITNLTPEQKANPGVRHALDVRTAVTTLNYHRLFRLFTQAPNMNKLVMNHFITRQRVLALIIIAQSYRSSVSVEFIAQELALGSQADALHFL
ncbi:SAC3/GANP/Nin1/mts3/eIF-3 p25, partial [Dimargaris cristalligena]